MLKEVYEVDKNGYISEIHVANFDDTGKPADDLADNIITISPTDGLYRAKWTGVEWVEGMSQEEIDELEKPQPHIPTDTEILGQQMTERELEAIVQGQQITDMDLRLFMVEMGAGQ